MISKAAFPLGTVQYSKEWHKVSLCKTIKKGGLTTYTVN